MKKIIFSLLALLFCSCSSVKTVPAVSESSKDYRNLQGALYQQQTEIAVAGQKIENQSLSLIKDLTDLEKEIASSSNAGEADRLHWLAQVRTARIDAETHQATIKNLNQQLAAEREIVKNQSQTFNEYEATMTTLLSDKTKENTQLRVENKTIKGQRNTLLGAILTAVSLVAIFLVIKFLKRTKHIPI
jgi:hypothetical protein